MSSPSTSGDDVRIRLPQPQDAGGLADVHVRGWAQAYGSLLPSRFYDDQARERRMSMWQRLLEDDTDRQSVRVADVSDRLVGFAWRGPSIAQGECAPVRPEQLYAIYVLQEWYGTGIGQRLLTETLGDRPAELWVARENERAQAFYRRNGFSLDGCQHVEQELADLVEVRMIR